MAGVKKKCVEHEKFWCADVWGCKPIYSFFFFWNSTNVLQKAKNFTNRIFNDSTKNIRFYDKEYRTDV